MLKLIVELLLKNSMGLSIIKSIEIITLKVEIAQILLRKFYTKAVNLEKMGPGIMIKMELQEHG